MHDSRRRDYCQACRAVGRDECDDCDFAMPEIYEENLEAWQVYTACTTQWRYVGDLGVVAGLDYTAVESVMRMLGVEDQADCFWRVRVMESVGLELMNEEVKRYGAGKGKC